MEKELSREQRDKASLDWVYEITQRRDYDEWQICFDALLPVIAAAGLSHKDELEGAINGVAFVGELKQLFRALHFMHQGKPYQL